MRATSPGSSSFKRQTTITIIIVIIIVIVIINNNNLRLSTISTDKSASCLQVELERIVTSYSEFEYGQPCKGFIVSYIYDGNAAVVDDNMMSLMTGMLILVLVLVLKDSL